MRLLSLNCGVVTAALGLCFLVMGVPDAATAQDKNTATKLALAKWAKQCSKNATKNTAKTGQSACAATYVIRDKRGRQIVSLMATRLKKKPYLEVVVPLGIFLPFGVRVQVDQKRPVQTNLIDCHKTGCRAFVLLDQAQIETLRAGKFVKIIFKDSKSQKALAVTGTLAGFSAAFAS